MHPWINRLENKTVVLLGAGASKPMVPLSNELTQLIKEELDEQLTSDNGVAVLWRAIRADVDKIDGNVEDVYQAIETLAYQSDDPTRHWVTGFKKYGNYEDNEVGRQKFQNDARLLAHLIVSSAYGIIDRKSEGAVLSHYELMLRAPLAGIVSLNYDLLIEHSASEFGIPVSTGAGEWDGGPRWRFPNESLPLLKLHGSVNWRTSRPGTPHWGIPRMGIFEVADSVEGAPNGRVDSTLVFGGGNKLRPDGPWPALYAAFEDLLATADTLVIIGYSFSDPHVDEAIRRWAAQADNRRVINIDPFPIENPSIYSSIGVLRYALDPEVTTKEGMKGIPRDKGKERFCLIKQAAICGIAQVFG